MVRLIGLESNDKQHRSNSRRRITDTQGKRDATESRGEALDLQSVVKYLMSSDGRLVAWTYYSQATTVDAPMSACAAGDRTD